MVKVRRLPAPEPHSRRFYDLIGLCLFFGGAAGLLWLTGDQGAEWGIPKAVTNLLRLLAGSGAWIVPILLMFIGAMYLIGYERLSFTHSTYGSLLIFLAFVTWRHLAVPIDPLVHVPPGIERAWTDQHVKDAGGYIGAVIGTIFLKSVGLTTSYLLVLLITCIALILLLDRPFIEILRHFQQPAAAGVAAARQGVTAVKQRGETLRENRATRLAERALGSSEEEDGLEEAITKKRGFLSFRRQVAPIDSESSDAVPKQAALPMPVETDEASNRRNPKSENQGLESGEPDVGKQGVAAKGSKASSIVPEFAAGSAENAIFKLPPLTLLKEAPPSSPKRAQQELADKIKILEQTLDQFGIGANVVEIAHGPTVTRYEIQLAPGIKVSKIVSLADNLAMALAAIDVRVEAPIPGKSAIGVEVPNTTATMVTLRDCIDTPEFRNAASRLTFALGKDVSGINRYADLTKMPHLLIGGSTNSGKSVCLNTIIASLLYRATPRELQFIMIDPKRVELSLWDGIPHLMHPVVKDVKQTAGIFRAALKEMERRYDMFSRVGTRNIDGYNQRATVDEALPYLVIVVDELADLMMQAAAEIETSICRLAQLARATGIHLVIATQRPSVDVITGTIKANISSRVAFAVSSQVDSRTILDMSGAERLIGRGDMLFLPIDASKPVRIQGCYLSEQETHTLVTYLKEQERPNYTILPVEVGGGGGMGNSSAEEDPDDDFYEAAVKLVVTNGQASTSMLQRRFKIGYTRAARLVDIMEDRGIVGPLDGAKPREILVSKDEIDQMFRDGVGIESL